MSGVKGISGEGNGIKKDACDKDGLINKTGFIHKC